MRHCVAISRLVTIVLALSLSAGAVAAESTAAKILDSTGIKGGIVVHLNCGDGKLTAGLRASDKYTVHGLGCDGAEVAVARSHIQATGLYGAVSVELFSGSTLPYTDNLINLMVVDEPVDVPIKEMMRVLAPGGSIYLRQDGKTKSITKKWPDEIDEWTHFLHDASNNAVANDRTVAPPKSLQWVSPPLWLRSHETPSGIQAPVSARGRLFYFFDEGVVGITDERLPERWSIICRDAFNGKLLWKRPLESWGWPQWSADKWQGKDWTALRSGRTDVPAENQRRLVADGDRIYTTVAYRGPMSILDAATGDTIKTIEATQGASEILQSEGVIVVYTRPMPGKDTGSGASGENGLVAIDARTTEVLWKKAVGAIRSLALSIDNGRVIYMSGKDLVARSLKNGQQLWKTQSNHASPRTMVTVDDVIVMQGGKLVVACDAKDGGLLWKKTVPVIGGGEGDDLFIVDGLVYRGMVSVNDDGKPVGKSPNALVIGWDLRSGQEKKRILVNRLRSPEHHHRCYRNKATVRYLISSYEGAEFLDFEADDHSQNNWIRGACKNGMVPCNGMLYVPPDQCFCQPGSKVLGYTAVKAASQTTPRPISDSKRLTKGPAYGRVDAGASTGKGDWPTLRHDAARSGATAAAVAADVSVQWKVSLSGKLTAPVAAAGKVLVAASDRHTLYAMDMATGGKLWQFTTGGRIDSPPTVYGGSVLLGSRDGYVYCLRFSDGQLAWRFLAASADVRIGDEDQIESAWPVHGSVLVHEGLAYFSAGRSTYLDGGIHVYGLEPASGKLVHKTVLAGPEPFEEGGREVAFFILGANSDVLVSEGGFLYMRQKKMTADLKEVEVPVLSSKGAQDVGLHVFSTAGLLDGSGYNRAFWMYSKRWPGFQLANQASKTGQLLVVGDEKTYAVRTFYRRNVHSPMFFPGKEGYLLFADLNTNEPQIVGEAGAKEPVEWLPQSGYSAGRANNMRPLDSAAFGLDKMIGYTRGEPPVWKQWLPVRIRAMVKAADTIFVAGEPDEFDAEEPFATFEGKKGASVVGVSAKTGKKVSETALDYPPVFDGMIAADGRLFASLRDGSVVCLTASGK